METNRLDQPIQYLKGVGPKRAKLFARIGITTLGDLVSYYPREYDDRRVVTKIAGIVPGTRVTVQGKVEASEVISLSRNLQVFKVAVADGTGLGFGQFYRSVNPYHRHDIFASLKQVFARGATVVLNGVAENAFGERQIKVEEYESCADPAAGELTHFKRIVPVYSLTEGISQKWLRELMQAALESVAPCWPDILPQAARDELRLPPAPEALKAIHFPDNFPQAEQARRRLAYDEFLILETALSLARRRTKEHTKPFQYVLKRNLLTPFREKLGFEFTAAQKKVINEIFGDLQKDKPMNRLLLGDVGSGKTVVALSAVLLAVENGYQAAILAPTEILAEQHYLTIRRFLEGLPVRIGLMTGKVSARKKEKEELRAAAASGELDVVVGTHALLEKDVRFKDLSLAVIDEQHRFGVMQRARLHEKGRTPDILIMTATPIPRTLALTVYGDMDVSVIDRLPPGRKPVVTRHLPELPAYDLVKREIRAKRQAYIVYPLVKESDKIELKAAVEEAEQLSATVFRGFRVGLLHGQMTAQEKDTAMRHFRTGDLDILISTTVIEVGIDVPNATVMVIEHADRFGLATLHQLRGRVGRGGETSYCVLLGAPRTDEARRRFEIMLATTDGFRIAEEDLALRGPGQFFGTAQHGMIPLKAGNLLADTSLIEKAREQSRQIVDRDPRLADPANLPLRAELLRIFHDRFGLIRIG